MKLLAILNTMILLSSCAQIAQSGKQFMKNVGNSEKYEKELPYKEGQAVELQVAFSDIEKSFSTRKLVSFRGNAKRFGNEGSNSVEIEGILFPDFKGYTPYFHPDEKFKINVKILSIGRECEADGYSNFCKPTSGKYPFVDKAQFISWGSDFTKKVNDYVATKQKEDANQALQDTMTNSEVDPEIQRRKHPQKAAQCDTYYKKIMLVKERLSQPALTEGEIKAIFNKDKNTFESFNGCAVSYLYTDSQMENAAIFFNMYTKTSQDKANVKVRR